VGAGTAGRQADEGAAAHAGGTFDGGVGDRAAAPAGGTGGSAAWGGADGSVGNLYWVRKGSPKSCPYTPPAACCGDAAEMASDVIAGGTVCGRGKRLWAGTGGHGRAAAGKS
jgi:hypothetical protein